MTGQADRWIRRTTIGCVAMLALIAGTVSYLHMHLLVQLHGQPGWVAARTPLSVDGMIVAASTTLLAESRTGKRGGFLPWGLLVIGSVASLAANVAVAEPTATSRVIAAWPSFALIASYELLVWLIRTSGAVERGLWAEQLCSRAACRTVIRSLPVSAVDVDRPGGRERHGSGPARRPAGQAARLPAVPASGQRDDEVPEASAVNDAAVAAYRLSVQAGNPLSERRLAQMFGRTSRRWARARIADARQSIIDPGIAGRPGHGLTGGAGGRTRSHDQPTERLSCDRTGLVPGTGHPCTS
jgi:Protein of unknown function (DUF2637)